MGLIRSVDDIQRTLEKTQRTKQKREAEKKRQELQKINIEALDNDIITGLKIDFENIIKNDGFEPAMLYLSNMDTKKAFITLYLNNHYQLNFRYKKRIESLINDNYFKILKQVESDHKKHIEYLKIKNKKILLYKKNLELEKKIFQKRQETQKLEEEYQKRKKETELKKVNKIINILLFTLVCVIFAPFALVAMAANALNKK